MRCAFWTFCFGTAVTAAMPSPAVATLAQQGETGFLVEVVADVPGKSPEQVWRALMQPAKWWDGAHSWSGKAGNLYIEDRAGGCFCERIPDERYGKVMGSVEHARVVAVMPSHLLRLSGALGPLQSEALAGTLSISLAPYHGGTHLAWTYVVGGYMRMLNREIAPAVDKVLTEQAERLVRFAGAIVVEADVDDRQGKRAKRAEHPL